MSSVYFLVMHKPADPIHDFGFVKVGVTDGDVATRIVGLQTGNPHDLRCIHAFETSCAREVEHYMHRKHAARMHNGEWLRHSANEISTLVEEAEEVARRFEERRSREDAVRSSESNGRERRADLEEMKQQRQVRKLHEKLEPARLRLDIAASQLKVATGATRGLRGIVRVKYVPETTRFSPQLAESRFPELTSQCQVKMMSGTFHWRRVQMRSRFLAEKLFAKEAAAAAKSAADIILVSRVGLEGWIEPTAEMKRLHDDFLDATQTVNRLEADLADLQTEFIILLGDYDALDPVCSFKRRLTSEIDAAAFRKMFPHEAAQCHESVAPQLRKHVYPTRSYL